MRKTVIRLCIVGAILLSLNAFKEMKSQTPKVFFKIDKANQEIKQKISKKSPLHKKGHAKKN